MKSRRTFLTSVAAGSAGLAFADAHPAAAAQAAPSGRAAAFAATLRAIDPQLAQADLDAIATAIDANATAAKLLNPKDQPLRNSDAPAVRFVPASGEA